MTLFGGAGGRGRPAVVGHRGGRGEGWPPENTLAAFERAHAEGAVAVETDVRLSATGEVVAFHDPDLKRMTAGVDARPIASVPLDELLRVPLLATDARIPTLDALLAWARERDTPLDIEIKHDVPDRVALVRAVARRLANGRAGVPVLVSSFDPFTLALFGALAPSTPLALLTDPEQAYAPALHAIACIAGRARALAALYVERRQATPGAIARWKRHRLDVGVWTVNDEAEARRLAALGVDVLITDRPGALVAALS
jgi:glycerophosphoryl diester phosphodiesterase